ncbi:hypothetical protein [Rossellomorea marisflavi]|uniref:hypothetical protein n=1 Tax=Rossellomorea marisflavi TaxID=189381 RepID=UPI001E5EDF48|nr:hypothetical protein [Rossellomorea marisflavi]
MQRRPPDSYGNSGQGETLQAAPKRLTARPLESGWPQRNGTVLSPPYTHKNRMALACSEPALSPSYAQSAVQRRPPDSYGNSGQGETLQAAPKRLTARPMESGWPQ